MLDYQLDYQLFCRDQLSYQGNGLKAESPTFPTWTSHWSSSYLNFLWQLGNSFTYQKNLVGTFTESWVIGAVNRCLTCKLWIKLTHILFRLLHKNNIIRKWWLVYIIPINQRCHKPYRHSAQNNLSSHRQEKRCRWMPIIFIFSVYFMHAGVLCISAYHMWAWYPQKLEEGVVSPRTTDTDGREPPWDAENLSSSTSSFCVFGIGVQT